MEYEIAFWEAVDKLIETSQILIDRPKGSRHPSYPDMLYEVDYGYLRNTSSMDGGGIDVWLGSASVQKADAIMCTVDLLKRDSEIKLLIGCTTEEKKLIVRFHNESDLMKGILIDRMP